MKYNYEIVTIIIFNRVIYIDVMDLPKQDKSITST